MMPPVRLALAGAGLIGRRHAAATTALPSMQLEWIVDPTTSGRDLAAEMGAAWFPSLTDMLAVAKPDGVILATPNQVHVENGMECVHAGCPMLIEKPIATSSAEAAGLLAAAEAASVPILVGHHRRHNPLVRQARAILDQGSLGRILAAHATCWMAKPDDYFNAAWRTRSGAGPVMVNAIHDVDLLRHFCGEVESVQAFRSSTVRNGGTKTHAVGVNAVEDSAVAILQFCSGAIGTLSVSDAIASPWSWETTSAENSAYAVTAESCYLIGGTRGSLSVPDNRLWNHGGDGHWMSPIRATSFPTSKEEPLIAQLRHFAAVIRGEAEPLVSGREGARSLAVVEAILRSAASGTNVSMTSLTTEEKLTA